MQRRFLTLVIASMLVLAGCARRHGDGVGSAAVSGSSLPNAGGAAPALLDGGSAFVGATATARLEPVDSAADGGRPFSGEASFSETRGGVDLSIGANGCQAGAQYPVYIQAGGDCSSAALLGPHWDDTRGAGITGIGCMSLTAVAQLAYTRASSDPKPWSVGNPATSDVVGHALIVLDPNTLQPLACGVIARKAGGPPPDAGSPAQPSAVPAPIRAQLAGYCLTQQIVRDNTQPCPDPSQFAKCASDHCGLDPCVAQCSDYIACLEQTSDPCADQSSCSATSDCIECQGKVTTCVLSFCAAMLACAAPIAPNGPCAQLEACCEMQGDQAASCLDTVHLIEHISGDPSCVGAMQDWDITAHLPVPCHFQ